MDLKSTRPVRGIAALDRLAERLIAATELRLAVADSPAELIAVHRLRYRDVAERGAQSADHADGLERDAYDARALQICAWDGDVLAGTVRLVLPVPGKRLPTEEAFDLTVEPDGEVVDSAGSSFRRASAPKPGSAPGAPCSRRPGSRPARAATRGWRAPSRRCGSSASARSGSCSTSSGRPAPRATCTPSGWSRRSRSQVEPPGP